MPERRSPPDRRSPCKNISSSDRVSSPDRRSRSDRRLRLKEAIEAARAILLYLPQYSPDLNPIELAFSKLKALLRKAAERTIPGLWRKIGSLVATFSARECRNYFKHAGYAFK